MIFADKLIALRKKHGITQEELAEQMNVSRQSVSKWESAQSVPDLDKMLRLSNLFGVTTDYLLKDELESPEFAESKDDSGTLPRITIEEANAFLEAKQNAAGRIALGVMLCILGPCLLLMLGAAGEAWGPPLEDLLGVCGVVALLALICCAVALFVTTGTKLQPYEWLEKQPFDAAYGVEGMVHEHQKKFRPIYIRQLCIGIGLCILCPAPLLIASALTEYAPAITGCVCILLAMVAVGVGVIVQVSIPWDAMQQLLQEGDYTPAKKKRAPVIGAVSTIYWVLVTALFLSLGFFGGNWGRSALIWPVAGVLFAAVMALCNLVLQKNES